MVLEAVEMEEEMKKKKVALKYVPQREIEYYSRKLCVPYNLFSNNNDEIVKWNIEEKHKDYLSKYDHVKLDKKVFQKFVNEIIELEKLNRKLTSREAEYLFELFRAIEPKKALYFLDKRNYLRMGKKSIERHWIEEQSFASQPLR